jgi:hypothetical protein
MNRPTYRKWVDQALDQGFARVLRRGRDTVPFSTIQRRVPPALAPAPVAPAPPIPIPPVPVPLALAVPVPTAVIEVVPVTKRGREKMEDAEEVHQSNLQPSAVFQASTGNAEPHLFSTTIRTVRRISTSLQPKSNESTFKRRWAELAFRQDAEPT